MPDDLDDLSGPSHGRPGFWVYCHRCWCITDLGTAVRAVITEEGLYPHDGWLCMDCAAEVEQRRPTEPSSS